MLALRGSMPSKSGAKFLNRQDLICSSRTKTKWVLISKKEKKNLTAIKKLADLSFKKTVGLTCHSADCGAVIFQRIVLNQLSLINSCTLSFNTTPWSECWKQFNWQKKFFFVAKASSTVARFFLIQITKVGKLYKWPKIQHTKLP
jgi:hypothetical protein